MPRAVARRKVKSFLGHFGPPALVWMAGVYCLYRATQLDGSTSERSFALGLLLVVCASMILSVRRSRQTTTRERALETQLQRLGEFVRRVDKRADALSNRLDRVILELDTDNAAQYLGQAVERHSERPNGKVRLINKGTIGKG